MDQKQQPRRQRRGNYSMLMGVMSLVVVGFGALAVDVSLITMAELQAQATADAASHAALIVYRENSDPSNSNIGQAEGNAAAGWILDNNKVAMGTAIMDTNYPRYGQWDYVVGAFQWPIGANEAVNAVQVRLSRSGPNAVEMLLAPALGYNKRDVDATSITAQQNRAVMLIQDMSCSMMTGYPGDTNSAVEYSRQAQRAFVQYISDRPQSGDMLGLAMFAQMGGKEPVGANPWGTMCGGAYNCSGNPAVGGRPMGTEPPWLPMQNIDSPLIFPRIDGICDTDVGDAGEPCVITGQPSPHLEPIVASGGFYWNDVGGCTNPEIAMLQAIDEILTKTDSTYFRAIVLMSDGVPNCDVNMNFNEPYAMSRALDAADIAAANGIHIYTALFHNGYFNSDFMTSADPSVGLVRGQGFGLVSPNASDLSAMLVQIAKSFPTAFMD
jgi:Flp pilus assembly protein TadG